MVREVRRCQSAYSLSKRHYDKVFKDLIDSKSLKRIFANVVTALQNAPNRVLRNVLTNYGLLLRQRIISIEGIMLIILFSLTGIETSTPLNEQLYARQESKS